MQGLYKLLLFPLYCVWNRYKFVILKEIFEQQEAAPHLCICLILVS